MSREYQYHCWVGMDEGEDGPMIAKKRRNTRLFSERDLIGGPLCLLNALMASNLSGIAKNRGDKVKLLFGSLYWVILHQKFDTEFGCQTFRDFMAKQLPPILRQLISALAIRGNHANLYGSGVGRMPHAAIIQKGRVNLACQSQLLGDRKYFFGGRQSMLMPMHRSSCSLRTKLKPKETHG
eukprot:scaffold4531_cov103-Cylindrotheca_fusiformis.AAC.7